MFASFARSIENILTMRSRVSICVFNLQTCKEILLRLERVQKTFLGKYSYDSYGYTLCTLELLLYIKPKLTCPHFPKTVYCQKALFMKYSPIRPYRSHYDVH
jgi:hypothetical protein